MIEVEGNRQIVQARPMAGWSDRSMWLTVTWSRRLGLVRFDDTLLRSELAIIESQLFAERPTGRLIAERDGSTDISFDLELLELAPSIAHRDQHLLSRVTPAGCLWRATADPRDEIKQLPERLTADRQPDRGRRRSWTPDRAAVPDRRN
jgi:hypothetical protein